MSGSETIEALRDAIWNTREASERDRRLAPVVVEQIRKTGLARSSLPRGAGGLAQAPPDTLALYETLARADASAPWILFNNALVCLFARFMGAQLRSEIFADSSQLHAQSTRPSAWVRDDGDAQVVSGRWTLVSGCELAEWMMLLCRSDGKDDETRFVVVHRSEVGILDTWESGGLRGTGSHDVVADELRVPAYRALDLERRGDAGEALEHVPAVSTVAAFFASIALGVAQGAVDALSELARAEGEGRPPGPAALVVALHSSRLAALRQHLRSALEATWARALAGAPASPEAIGAVYGAVHVVCEDAEAAVDAVYRAAGTRALYNARPFDRARRDLHAMRQHVIARSMWAEDAGRVHLGGSPEQPLYAL